MQNDSTVQLQCCDAAVAFKVAVKERAGQQAAVCLYSTCVNTSKLAPMTASIWDLDDESAGGWRAAVATASINDTSGAVVWDAADYQARDQNAITQFSAPKKAELVHTVNSTNVSYWHVDATHLLRKRIGIALYERACFPPMGFGEQILYGLSSNIGEYQVCDFTVRTLGCAQPAGLEI
jgi:hypothetical protein